MTYLASCPFIWFVVGMCRLSFSKCSSVGHARYVALCFKNIHDLPLVLLFLKCIWYTNIMYMVSERKTAAIHKNNNNNNRMTWRYHFWLLWCLLLKPNLAKHAEASCCWKEPLWAEPSQEIHRFLVTEWRQICRDITKIFNYSKTHKIHNCEDFRHFERVAEQETEQEQILAQSNLYAFRKTLRAKNCKGSFVLL